MRSYEEWLNEVIKLPSGGISFGGTQQNSQNIQQQIQQLKQTVQSLNVQIEALEKSQQGNQQQELDPNNPESIKKWAQEKFGQKPGQPNPMYGYSDPYYKGMLPAYPRGL